MIKSNRGQLSIFMGITLILVMGMLAFIINIGLFVKAKINLQNAVDAAAFSGAATQARQLTNMAYLNWEMRNTYKEWMFKYYILGQMGLVKGNNNLSDSGLNASGSQTSFLLRTPDTGVVGNTGTSGNLGFDKFNVPSICVHNNSSTDICPIYALPGIPRFPAIGVAGISEIHEAFVNKLVEEKGANCSERTQLNFLAALSWAYSSGIKEITGAPLIATNRAGAWPEALELAMRMRNLEMIMNRPPLEDLSISNISSYGNVGNKIGLNERPIKAFISAYKNLSGGKYKGTNADELSNTFKLTEVAPQPFDAQPNTVSGFLIPDYGYPGGGRARQKHYVDLQIVPVNYATMFTTFATTRNEFEPTVDSEASCFVSKSAMPVPGYIMGFVKNPAVLTYYAVKGEAEFTGLFFPRTNAEDQPGSFKLTAYAAAKPFGGRIGPKLFGFQDGNTALIPRGDKDFKSAPFISGINVGLDSTFKPGLPIPPSADFWVNEFTSLVGGIPGSGAQVSYGIPNMIYDVQTPGDLTDQVGGAAATGGKIQTVKAQPIANSSTSENKGLYRTNQIRYLKAALGGDFTGMNMTSDDLMKALVRARQVTRYDAINYLIPDFNRPTSQPRNAAPTIKIGEPVPGGVGFYYKLFAPLVGPDLLYTSNTMLTTVIGSYIAANDSAIDIYLQALLDVGKTIFALPSGVGSATNVNAQAAQSIHANAGISNSAVPPLLVSADPDDPAAPTCKKDMASKFNHFFRGKFTQCGIVPLEDLMIEYINKKNLNGGDMYYTATYLNNLGANEIMTAYFPGKRQGATDDLDAMALNPIGATATASYSTRRNYYSTKFVPFSNLFQSSSIYTNDVFVEDKSEAPLDIMGIIQQNPVLDDTTTGFNKPYYRDF